MDIELIKNKISELFENTPEDVGVMFGKKSVNGVYSDELSVVFTVKKKIPLEEIPEELVLPKSIQIGDKLFSTDVIEVEEIVPMFACSASISSQCYGWQPPQGVNPNVPQRNQIRPLQGGVSLTSMNKLGGIGTMGFIAADIETDALFGVTNNHVVVADPFFTAERNLFGIRENELFDRAYQSGDGYAINIAEPIGYVYRYAPVKESPYLNYVDGALVSVRAEDIQTGTSATNASWKQYGMTGITSPLTFATTQEIDELLTNPPSEVKSVGRTTGVKQGPCGLQITGILASVTVGYPRQRVNTAVRYGELIQFTRLDPGCPWPIYGGDSGSALVAVINGTPKIIGLNAWGSVNGSFGYASRIDRVAQELGIKAWNGVTHRFIDEDSPKLFTIVGGSFDTTLTCSGETYWQLGLTDLAIPCN